MIGNEKKELFETLLLEDVYRVHRLIYYSINSLIFFLFFFFSQWFSFLFFFSFWWFFIKKDKDRFNVSINLLTYAWTFNEATLLETAVMSYNVPINELFITFSRRVWLAENYEVNKGVGCARVGTTEGR